MAYERKTIDIFVSDELKQFLSQIEHDSYVAHLLLKKRHNKEDLVDNPVNYISLSNQDKTKVSYLTPERIESLTEDAYWNSTRRFQAKPGAFVSKIFKNVPAREVEKFSNFFRSAQKTAGLKLKVVTGNDIKHYYHWESYQNSDRGTLGASCMKHDGCQRLLDIYSDNSDKISMLVLIDENDKLVGRALLWHFDSYKIMDRIYTVCDEDYSYQLKKWGYENGYLHKAEQNWYNTLFFDSKDKKNLELKMCVKINSECDYYPYMDTFKFIDRDGYLYNYQPTGTFWTLCSTDGCKQSCDYLRFDGVSKVFRYHHDACWIEYAQMYTHGNNVQWSEINDTYILHNDCTYSDELNDYIFNEEKSHLNNQTRIQERIEYMKQRASRRKKSSTSIPSSWISEYLNSNAFSADSPITQEDMSRIYSLIGRRSNDGYNEYTGDLQPVPTEE